jgi:hypothetical protein
MRPSLSASLLEGQDREPFVISDNGAAYIDRSCCCFRIAYFPLGRFTVCGHWKVQLMGPIFVYFLYSAIHSLFVLDTTYFHRFPSATLFYAALCTTGGCLLGLAVSYTLLIARGPGYVPFNWGQSRARHFSWDHAMASMVQYSHQLAAARQTNERPPRSAFGSSACRFVLRADHYCRWVQSWVGIRNHRFFMLTCLWCVLYALANLGFRFTFYREVILHFELRDIPGIVSVLVLLYFVAFSGYHFCFAARNLARNTTALELWNDRPAAVYNRGCIRNYEEVCGSRKWILCWPVPCCACFAPLEDGFYGAGRVDSEVASVQSAGTGSEWVSTPSGVYQVPSIA